MNLRYSQAMKVIIVCSFIITCFKETLQCGCPYNSFTQQLVCDSQIVMNAVVHEKEETAENVIFNITINRIYKGAETVANLPDADILMTTQSSSMCGPVGLRTNTAYIMTANALRDDNIMRVSFCDYVAEASSIGSDALDGIENGSYLENCACRIPSIYSPTRRGKNWCKFPRGQQSDILCRFDSICTRNRRGRCKFRPCRPTMSRTDSSEPHVNSSEPHVSSSEPQVSDLNRNHY